MAGPYIDATGEIVFPPYPHSLTKIINCMPNIAMEIAMGMLVTAFDAKSKGRIDTSGLKGLICYPALALEDAVREITGVMKAHPEIQPLLKKKGTFNERWLEIEAVLEGWCHGVEGVDAMLPVRLGKAYYAELGKEM